MFKQLPVAWLQLKYQKIKLIILLLGVVFAVVIVFMQLGLRDALFDSAVRFHQSLNGDCVLIGPRSTSLASMDKFTERRVGQVLAFPEVDFATSIYLGFAQWKNPQTRNYWRNIFAIGFDTRYQAFTSPEINQQADKLNLPGRILFDRESRQEFGPIVSDFHKHREVITEIGSDGANSKTHVVGLFSLGMFLGMTIGVIIIYQILYTNVSEHLPEYATLKAMGYRHRYLLNIVFQQAFFIAIMGYVPGVIIAIIQYEVTRKATLLPISMTLERAIFVFISTVAMCLISGAAAVRKLQEADPADIF